MKTIKLDYTNCPENLQGGLQRYFEERLATGSFLRAVLENNLVQTYQKADESNIQADSMLKLLRWLYNEAPSLAWGSEEKVAKWLAGDIGKKLECRYLGCDEEKKQPAQEKQK